MTTQRLHDLLEELVTDATPADGVDAAWERAARTRRRRRLAAVAGTTVAALAVGAVILNRPDTSSRPPSPRRTRRRRSTRRHDRVAGSVKPTGHDVRRSRGLVEPDARGRSGPAVAGGRIAGAARDRPCGGSARHSRFGACGGRAVGLRARVRNAAAGRAAGPRRLLPFPRRLPAGPVQDAEGNARLSPLIDGSLAPDGQAPLLRPEQFARAVRAGHWNLADHRHPGLACRRRPLAGRRHGLGPCGTGWHDGRLDVRRGRTPSSRPRLGGGGDGPARPRRPGLRSREDPVPPAAHRARSSLGPSNRCPQGMCPTPRPWWSGQRASFSRSPCTAPPRPSGRRAAARWPGCLTPTPWCSSPAADCSRGRSAPTTSVASPKSPAGSSGEEGYAASWAPMWQER